jgi:predicted nucleic acid-binding protein
MSRKEIEYVLDTCLLLNFLASKQHVIEKLLSIDKAKTFVTPITIAEAYYGMMLRKIGNPSGMQKLLGDFGVIPLNNDVAMRYAQIKYKTHLSGCKYDKDLWMVAFCDLVGATLLTTDAELQHRLRDADPPIEVIPI